MSSPLVVVNAVVNQGNCFTTCGGGWTTPCTHMDTWCSVSSLYSVVSETLIGCLVRSPMVLVTAVVNQGNFFTTCGGG